MSNDNELNGLDILFASLRAATEGRDVNQATSDAIVASEKRGQQKLVASEILPKEMRYVTRPQLEELGFVLGTDVDDIFIRCTLPAGWKKVPTDHDMWSDLYDDAGNVRASIFYKAAFYDRSATLYWKREE